MRRESVSYLRCYAASAPSPFTGEIHTDQNYKHKCHELGPLPTRHTQFGVTCSSEKKNFTVSISVFYCKTRENQLALKWSETKLDEVCVGYPRTLKQKVVLRENLPQTIDTEFQLKSMALVDVDLKSRYCNVYDYERLVIYYRSLSQNFQIK